MVDISAVAGALSSLKAVKDIAESMIGLSNAESVRGKVLEIQSKMLDAQAFAFAAQEERTALVERVRDLEKEVTALKAWGAEKKNYELKRVAIGAFARVGKEEMRGAEPNHWLCDNCYQHSKKSTLQGHGRDPCDARTTIYKCGDQQCGAMIRVPWDVNPDEPDRPSA